MWYLTKALQKTGICGDLSGVKHGLINTGAGARQSSAGMRIFR